MNLYILGIGGTFMGHLALLAKQLGFKVSGCDKGVYSPMREMLLQHEISYDEGYELAHIANHSQDKPPLYVIGNAISRGNPIVEFIMNQRLPMTSGPQWLSEQLLAHKWVIAVAGTHGKTTTTSMITWILMQCGYKPGYLIGGAAKGFEQAADIGDSDYFVIEADEYDTAFFDKRSKFIHYRPRTLVLNNLEFDHADIFDDLAAIQKTFHHLVRTVPSEGRIVLPATDAHLAATIQKGCWSELYKIGEIAFHQQQEAPDVTLQVRSVNADGSHLEFCLAGKVAHLTWPLIGRHNMHNAAAAVAAVQHVGVELEDALHALASFPGVARRMERRFNHQGLSVYDDFAHHATAIATSLQGLRAKVGNEFIVAMIEPRSNTMCMGVQKDALPAAVALADEVYWLKNQRLQFDLHQLQHLKTQHFVFDSAREMLNFAVKRRAERGDGSEHWLCMSNGAFDGLFQLMAEEFVD